MDKYILQFKQNTSVLPHPASPSHNLERIPKSFFPLYCRYTCNAHSLSYVSRLYDVLFLTQNPILSWAVYTVHWPQTVIPRDYILKLELVEDIQKAGHAILYHF